jgi:hypothetical protein
MALVALRGRLTNAAGALPPPRRSFRCLAYGSLREGGPSSPRQSRRSLPTDAHLSSWGSLAVTLRSFARTCSLTNEMAEHAYMSCTVCGATLHLEKFGIDGDAEFDAPTAPSYPLKLSRKTTGGGNKGISWQHELPSEKFLLALRARLAAELESLDAILAGSGAIQICCVTCGTFRLPDAFGIERDHYVAMNAPRYDTAIARTTSREGDSATWEAEDIPIALARALLHRLEAVTGQVSEEIADISE